MQYKFNLNQIVNIIEEGWERPLGYAKIVNRKTAKRIVNGYPQQINYYMLDTNEIKEETELAER